MNKQKTLNGRHVLAIMLGFFGVIIVVNTIFVTYAVRSFPGEYQKKSYMQGLQFNEVLAERAAQEALGWRVEIVHVDPAGAIEIAARDKSGTVLRGLSVAGSLKRPTNDENDRDMIFQAMADGVYRAEAGALLPGAWDLSLNIADGADARLDANSRIIVE